MEKTLKDRLVALGAEKLADLLIDLSAESDFVNHAVDRAVASPSKNKASFLRRLREMPNRPYIPWKYSAKFGRELSDLLEDLKQGEPSPEEGFDLICAFFRADEVIFECSDDSSGHIGDVFRGEAIELFSQYAEGLKDRKYLLKTLIDLVDDDGYGVRGYLIENCHKFLTETEMRDLYGLVEIKAREDKREYNSWESDLRTLAKLLRDASLFEQLTKDRFKGEPHGRALVEIAEVYVKAGDLAKAQSLLDLVPDSDSFSSHDKRDLQKKIHRQNGDTEKLRLHLEAEFEAYYSDHTLKELLSVAGEEQREPICRKAIDTILRRQEWSSSDVEFLIYCDAIDEAEELIFRYSDTIDGDYYSSILPIAEAMVDRGRLTAASVLYRALIDSILRRAKSKYYHHAVNYLEKLEAIGKSVSDWRPIDSHDVYLEKLKRDHRNKSSFWPRAGWTAGA